MRDMVVLVGLDSESSSSVAKKLRGEGVYSVILSAADAAQELPEGARGLVLCGGMVGEKPDIPQMEALCAHNLPILALGDAALALCCHIGGALTESAKPGGVMKVEFSLDEPLLSGVESSERFLPVCRGMYPAGAVSIAAAEGAGCIGLRAVNAPFYALAFLPESNDPDGLQVLINFSRNLCNCSPWWTTRAFAAMAVEDIAQAAGDGSAICAVSGGIDSTLCAKLGALALEDRLHCLFIDTGLLREGEADQVMDLLQGQLGLQVRRVNAAEEFIQALAGITDPGEKERTVFAHIQAHLRHEVAQYPDTRIILRGTNYSDALSLDAPAPLEMTGARVRIIEPVRYLFKDEIRRVAEDLQLPPEVCQRQPFPGSGLSLRLLPEVTPEGLSVLRRADAIFTGEIEAAGLSRKLWQYYAIMMKSPFPDDDVQYVALRALQPVGPGALPARLPSDLVERVTARILEDCPVVRRVYYDMTPKEKLQGK